LCHGSFERTVGGYEDGPEPPVRAEQFYLAGIDPDVPDGVALYDLTCASCHKDLSNSEVDRESWSEIKEKIYKDKGGMGPLSVLSDDEIKAIAAALGGTDSGGDSDSDSH
jgi:hypothetical protein